MGGKKEKDLKDQFKKWWDKEGKEYLKKRKRIDFKHYKISQALNFIWFIIIWPICFCLILQKNSQTVMGDTLYLSLIYLVVALLMYLVLWKPNMNCIPCLIVFGIIGLIAGGLWIGFYYSIFDPYFKYEYTKATDCEVTNVKMADLDGSEKYAVLTMKFQHPSIDEKFVGHACASSAKKNGILTEPRVYEFYDNGDEIGCGDDKGIGVQLLNVTSLNSPYYTPEETDDGENQTRRRRNLLSTSRSRTSRSRTSRSRNRKNRSTTSSNKTESDCNYKYDFSQVKLPAWKCEEFDNFEVLASKARFGPIKYDTCYFSRYGNMDKANMNAMNSTGKAEDMEDFYMVIFDDFPYYDETSLVLIIIFCLVPFVTCTHFCWIPFAADKIYLSYFYTKEDAEKYKEEPKGGQDQTAQNLNMTPYSENYGDQARLNPMSGRQQDGNPMSGRQQDGNGYNMQNYQQQQYQQQQPQQYQQQPQQYQQQPQQYQQQPQQYQQQPQQYQQQPQQFNNNGQQGPYMAAAPLNPMNQQQQQNY